MQVKSEEHKSAILILATDEHGAIPLIDGALRDYKQGVGSSWCEAPRWPGRGLMNQARNNTRNLPVKGLDKLAKDELRGQVLPGCPRTPI